jgi:uncharacterized protein DUF6098
VAELEVIEDWDELVCLVRERPGLFLRFSEGPAIDEQAGCSRDYEADVDLPGLSVTTIDPEPWWTRPAEDWIARRLCKYAELGEEEERFPWLLTGRRVGVGPDHEPVVKVLEPVARLGQSVLDHAAARYQEQFHVGRDSRG